MILELRKTEKTVKVLFNDENKDNLFVVFIDFFCTSCADYRCLHVIELIKKLEVKQ